MQAITTYDENSVDLNALPLYYWFNQSKLNSVGKITPELNNGRITLATQAHRVYVWATDKRVNYI
jgi:hypothetical protein